MKLDESFLLRNNNHLLAFEYCFKECVAVFKSGPMDQRIIGNFFVSPFQNLIIS